MKHINVNVTGRVQGVFFRESTRKQAESLGLVGFVRNELDGSVYIEAEGEEKDLNRLLAWVKEGPTHAVVESVDVSDGELQHYSQFSVEY